MEADSETAVEEETLEPQFDTQTACRVCGHHNREGNKFCGACGIALVTDPPGAHAESQAQRSSSVTPASLTPVSQQYDLSQTPSPGREAVDEVHPPAGAAPG